MKILIVLLCAAGGEGIYWKYESTLKALDARLYSAVGAAGELFAVRRELFEAMEPDTLLDDFILSLRITMTDSDWDILILLDKLKIEAEDYDNVSYPLVELGWSLNECVSPVLYTLKDWMRYHFSPFVHNVKDEGIRLL